MNKNKIIYIISSTLIVIALILGVSFKSAFDHINSIKVTGSSKTDFISDTIVWKATFGAKNLILEQAYKKLDIDKKIISKYLVDNNVPEADFVFSSISISKDYENRTDRDGIRTREFVGFNLHQNIKIESKAVNEIEHLSREVTSLIDKGLEIQSEKPYYFYSKLSDLKIDMIAQATKDASLRAKKIAESANSRLGNLINAQMGVFQIVAKNSTENYTWGGRHNKTSKHKTASVTAKLEYNIGL
ncbi:SIMPL domain-containing protein [Candidatus Marinimicrobia bacterium]|nr:SIMPL domain-containing protein [Candidatus Neomarinimicrobiota bacterium]